MSKFEIAVVVGSLRRDSFNKKLAKALAMLAPDEMEFRPVEIDDLPLYNQDDDDNQAPAVKRLKSEIEAAHGVLFITPEYNRSVPGVLIFLATRRLKLGKIKNGEFMPAF